MSDKVKRDKGQDPPEVPPEFQQSGEPLDESAKFQAAPGNAAKGGGAGQEQTNASNESCQADAVMPTGTAGVIETDCLEVTGEGQGLQAGVSSDPDQPEEAKGEDREASQSVEGSQREMENETADEFTPTQYSAMEKLIDAFALTSHDGFLGCGGDTYPFEPDREQHALLPALDLVRRGDSIEISWVRWDGPHPRLATSATPVDYAGKTYRVPSLPSGMYDSLFLPTALTSECSAREVFDGIYDVLQRASILSDGQCELLTFWCIATWFADVLDFVPRLTITGSRYVADLLFQLLRTVCRRAVLLAGIKPAVLKQIPMNDFMPTLLIGEIKVSKSASELLDASDQKGYFVACGGDLHQFYCAKCVYIGEEYNPKQTVNGLHIHLSPNVSLPARPYTSGSSIQWLQNQLFTYRSFNLDRISHMELTSGEFLPNFDVVARRLGAVILEDCELQERVAEILREQNEQTRVDRACGIEAIVLRAVLVHAHQGEAQVYVREVAATANQICIEHGESLKLSSEKVGHVLKRLELFTRRLGSGGRGLVLNKSTQIRAHQLSLEYDVLPPAPECGYCQSLQSPPQKEVM